MCFMIAPVLNYFGNGSRIFSVIFIWGFDLRRPTASVIVQAYESMSSPDGVLPGQRKIVFHDCPHLSLFLYKLILFFPLVGNKK